MMGFEPYIWSNVMTALLLWGAVFVVRFLQLLKQTRYFVLKLQTLLLRSRLHLLELGE